MPKGNKFGFEPLQDPIQKPKKDRAPGPMGAAEATESKLEQRKQNAADAKEFREAQADGRVLLSLKLEDIHTNDLPRDRLELEAVGRYQLKKGWRRFTALSQLFAETGDPDYSQIIARAAYGAEVRIARYIDMVEENVVREDLSFAEMAQVALTAASDPKISSTK